MSEQHEEHHFEHQSHDNVELNNNLNKPSAPPSSDDNGFYVVEQNNQNQQSDAVIENVLDSLAKEINKAGEVASNILSAEQPQQPQQQQPVEVPKKPEQSKCCNESSVCSLCPYYLLGGNCLSKIQLPPKVQDLVLWKDPKYTGAVFGSSLVLLLSLATFSLLTVVSSLMLLGLTAAGAYRLYLSVLFRIKGTYDDTFDKISAMDFSLPKDKIKNLAHLLETDVNNVLNQAKSIILWDNIRNSLLAFVGFYVIYSIGSVFNTLTLLIIVLVDLFTLPKVYQVYKQPIDQAFATAADFAHNIARQVSAKLPFLHKKKAE